MTHPDASSTVPADRPTAPQLTAVQLTAAQWRGIEGLLPPPNARGRPFTDRRSVMGGVVWQYLTSCPWRTVPRHYAPWQTCYHYRRELDRLGVWEVIVRTLGLVPQVRRPLTTGDLAPPFPDGWPEVPE